MARESVVDPVRTWVDLLDRASRHGYSVITTFDEESHVDVPSRQIRVSADQSPDIRVRDLERLVHTLSHTVSRPIDHNIDRDGAAPRREPVYPPETNQSRTHVLGVPTDRRVVAAIPAPRPSRPAGIPIAAPDSTPLFDALLRELGWVHRDDLIDDRRASPHLAGHDDVIVGPGDILTRDEATNSSTAHTAHTSGPVLSCDLVAPRLGGAYTATAVGPAHDLAQARTR
jgi:hypothetical protein